MPKKKMKENPLYKSGFFNGLSRGLESAIVNCKFQSISGLKSGDLASFMARNISDCLLVAKVLSTNGRPIAQMKAQYLLEISRYFGEDELARLEEDPKKFVLDFSLNPCQKDKSQTSFLCYILEKSERNMAGFWLNDEIMKSMKPAFQDFRTLTQVEIDGEIVSMSPFEIISSEFIKDVINRI